MYFILLVASGFKFCFSVRLDPLENNDKLQDVNNQYIAEWQWESWPMKQESTEQDSRSPGARLNAALWKDNVGPTWYLFGGQPVDNDSSKIYSDVWKYSVTSRTWERVFPSQTDTKGKSVAKIGGMMTLRANLFDENHYKSKYQNPNIVLCGRASKKLPPKVKKTNYWNNFTRRKKQESKVEESKSLAVYAPRTSKANTVWQIDLKDKLWTAYVCCCDTSNSETGKQVVISQQQKQKKNASKVKNESLTTSSEKETNVRNETLDVRDNIDKTEEKIETEQQHMSINSSPKKKKSNQFMKKEKEKERSNEDPDMETSEHVSVVNENREIDYLNNSRTIHIFENFNVHLNESGDGAKNENDSQTKTKRAKLDLKSNVTIAGNETYRREASSKTPANTTERTAKMASKYCPDFSEDGQPVSWCDGSNDVLITADISSPQLVLWFFNLRTSHWSQQEIEIAEDTVWPACSGTSMIRYAGNSEQVFIACAPPPPDNDTCANCSASTTDPSKTPSVTKLMFRIDSKRKILQSLGQIELSSFFASQEGQQLWQNESKALMHVIKTTDNETIFLMVYQESVDLWILTQNHEGKFGFEPVRKIWRGSAQKWFDKYNAAMYNLQFVSENEGEETVLIMNPRVIPANEYWPKQRGRFIIRILKNENLKNRSLENRTREHNLTYELLQADYKPEVNQGPFVHSYNLKVAVFFGISLAIFTIFGFVIFLKRCVNCPARVLIRSECHKSPPIIRYSVIPDDLLYPVA